MRWPDAVDGKITLEWVVKGKCGIFRWHKEPFNGPAPIIGACFVEVYSPTSYEIKALVASMGKELIKGYRSLVSIMEKEGYTGPRIERYSESGDGTVIVDGKRIEAEIAQKTGNVGSATID
jgi:hypothetical protein